MITLRKVCNDDRELLFNLNQKYLYEMTNYYDDEPDENGILHYGYFDAYFSDPLRSAYLIKNDDTLCGFLMLHPYSYFGSTTDHVLAEFTIFPMYRRQKLASEAVKILFDTFPGRWEIKYNEKNTAAKYFWNQCTQCFKPDRIAYSDTETVLVFTADQTGVSQGLPA